MIYFIQAEDRGIKVGYTKHKEIAQRLSAIQVGCPLKMEVLGVIEGEYGDEKELHSLFTGSRIRGEWFSISVLSQVTKIIRERGLYKDDMPLEVQQLWTLNRAMRLSKDEDIINHLVYEKEQLLKGQWIAGQEVN